MANEDDESVPTEENEVKIGDFKPTTTRQYTSETLTWGGILKRRGFLSHGGYWGEPRGGNCLGVVIDQIPALGPVS